MSVKLGGCAWCTKQATFPSLPPPRHRKNARWRYVQVCPSVCVCFFFSCFCSFVLTALCFHEGKNHVKKTGAAARLPASFWWFSKRCCLVRPRLCWATNNRLDLFSLGLLLMGRAPDRRLFCRAPDRTNSSGCRRREEDSKPVEFV